MKTHENKRDFIKLLMSMTHTEINDYIKKHGKGPKPVNMCKIITKENKDGKEV